MPNHDHHYNNRKCNAQARQGASAIEYLRLQLVRLGHFVERVDEWRVNITDLHTKEFSADVFFVRILIVHSSLELNLQNFDKPITCA